jgi:hypothetical protein
MDKIVELDEQFTESATAHVDGCLQSLCSTAPLDRAAVERAVTALYAHAGLKKPLVVYCQSPWQLCLMPIFVAFDWLYENTLHHFTEKSLVAEQIEELSKDCPTDLTESLMSRFQQMRGPDGYGRPGKLVRQKLNDALFENFSENFDVRAPLNYFEMEPYRASVKVYKEIYNKTIPDLPRLMEPYLRHFLPEPISLDVTLRVGDSMKSVLPALFAETADYFGSHFFDMSLFRDIAHFDFIVKFINEKFNQELELNEKMNIVKLLVMAAPMYLPFENFCFVCENPSTMRISVSDLAGTEEAALGYSDGLELSLFTHLAGRRVLVPKRETVSLDHIKKQKNIEVRRIMIEHYGPDRFIEETKLVPVKADKFGKLYRCVDEGFEDIVMLQVVDATPTEDGKFRHYWLRVPPTVRTPRQAVAWSFRLSENEYHPEVES